MPPEKVAGWLDLAAAVEAGSYYADSLLWRGPPDEGCRCSLCLAPDDAGGVPDVLPAVDACGS